MSTHNDTQDFLTSKYQLFHQDFYHILLLSLFKLSFLKVISMSPFFQSHLFIAIFFKVLFFKLSTIFQSLFEVSFFKVNIFNLKYYFQRHVCVSIRQLVSSCVRRLAPIPAGESQDVTNKSCSICLMGDPWGPGCSRTQNVPAQRVLSSII